MEGDDYIPIYIPIHTDPAKTDTDTYTYTDTDTDIHTLASRGHHTHTHTHSHTHTHTHWRRGRTHTYTLKHLVGLGELIMTVRKRGKIATELNQLSTRPPRLLLVPSLVWF